MGRIGRIGDIGPIRPIRPMSAHTMTPNLSPPGDRDMGIFDKLKGELLDIIQWTEPADNQVMAYRFPRYNNEIKYGAKLTVREGQAAVFVNQGQIADVFGPGMYQLETKNLPI